MSKRRVQAVIAWRYGTTVAKAVWGRYPGSTSFTKDFLQVPVEYKPIVDRALGRPEGSAEPVELQYRWPGAESLSGQWRDASDSRGNLSWKPISESPLPWRLGDSSNPAITFSGTARTATVDEAMADASLQSFIEAGHDPFILAIKLFGDDAILYPRAYYGFPPDGHEERGIATLPSALRDFLSSIKPNSGAATEFQMPPQSRAPELVETMIASLQQDPNLLLTGPPGTGKTVALEDLQARFLAEENIALYFDPDVWDGAWSEDELGLRRALSLVFHPSYGYEDFVAGLLPSISGANMQLTARPGPLVELAHWAAGSSTRKALLIIDEFNRGATAAIFGDTIALLDKEKRTNSVTGRAGAEILRPYARQLMEVDESFKNEKGEVSVGSRLSLPSNLWIVAALNSSDRSVTPLDAALRRRFAIIPVEPDYIALARHLGVSYDGNSSFAPASEDPEVWSLDDAKRFVIYLLKALNERVEALLSADLLLGHALVWSVGGDDKTALGRSLATAFDQRIASAMRMTFIDQDDALAAILKAGTAQNAGGGQVAYWAQPPADMDSTIAMPRLRIRRQGDEVDPIQVFRNLKTLL